jgi:ribosome-associated protein
MDIRKLQRAIVDGLEDVKAQDIRVFNTEALSPLFERVIIASGTSNRQTKALASSVREAVKSRGLAVLRTEGEENGEWIIVDCGAAVAHIMQPSIRDYYHLEEIWGGKPVRLKRDAVVAGLPKASDEPMVAGVAPRPSSTAKARSRKPVGVGAPEASAAAAKSTSSPRRPVRTSASRADADPARKPAARKTSASASPARKIVRKTAAKTAAKAASKTASKTASKSVSRTASKVTSRAG